jgi:hypothetical protein
MFIGFLTSGYGFFFLALLCAYPFVQKKWPARASVYLWSVIAAISLFHASLAAFWTVKQFEVWNTHELTRILLSLPADSAILPHTEAFNVAAQMLFKGSPNGYFLYYSYGRFWVHALLSVGIPFALFGFLRLILALVIKEKKIGIRELQLFLSGMLMAGWPGSIVFLVWYTLVLLVCSASSALFLRKFSVRFPAVLPVIIGVALTLLSASWVIGALGLRALYI